MAMTMLKGVKVSFPVYRSLCVFPLKNWSCSSCSVCMNIQRGTCLIRKEERKSRTVNNYIKDRSFLISHCFAHYPGTGRSTLIKCWKCNSEVPLSTHFCEKCSSLQPLHERLNAFEILGIEKVFNVDVGALKKAFRKLQTLFHPDKFSLKVEVGCFCIVI